MNYVGIDHHRQCYQLNQFQAPELPAATYEYYNGQSDQYELTKVNTPFGGSMTYTFDSHTFYFNVQSLLTRVVTQKKIMFSASGPEYVWNYTYPTYWNSDQGTVNVQGPVFNTDITYNAYSAANPWKIGLLRGKTLSDGSYAEEYEWLPQILSVKRWYVLNIDMGPATAALLSYVQMTRKGDASSKKEYLYEREAIKKYGLPSRINEYGNSRSLKNYKTLAYYFESDGTFASKYMVSYISNESDFDASGTPLKETRTAYSTSPGSCGAIIRIRRLKSSGVFLTWDYTYASSNLNLITITADLPGNAGIETYEYRYGVLSKIIRPGYTELTRTISQHDSSILSETNQHGGTMSFTYDGLGRIKNINMPSGFNAVTAAWSTNSVSISQGGNTIVKYWDGLGRDTGHTESGDGTTLYYRKTLDAEGRLIAENRGSLSSSNTYTYELTALGQIKKITDPRGEITSFAYASNTKTVTDAENHVTVFTHGDLPGLVTSVRDALNLTANLTYDGLGRLTGVVYAGARTQTYLYDAVDHVINEFHPETGLIVYAFSPENNLYQKDWAGTSLSYSYNSSNQLTSLNSGDETISYQYDGNGRLNNISSSKGWSRTSITYNALGSVTGETQTIPGLSSKTLRYAYDGNNLFSAITYPDGKSASIVNNGLKMPETITFNAKRLISSITYGYAKQPTAITIPGNGTSFSASYDTSGQLSTATFKKGVTILYKATYTYDGVGNIAAISNTKPALNLTCSYDAVYRLTSTVYTPATAGRVSNFNYTYDSYGNMTAVRENGATVFQKTYSTKNQIDGFSYDGRGNLQTDGSYQYVWDNQNRLDTLKNSSGSIIATYLYNERGLRLKAARGSGLASSIVVRQGKTHIANGSNYAFETSMMNKVEERIFTIENIGTQPLVLNGNPEVAILGSSGGQFQIVQRPSPSIGPGESTNFIIRFSPGSADNQIAKIAIPNNDLSQNPYKISITRRIIQDESSKRKKESANSDSGAGSEKYIIVNQNSFSKGHHLH